MTCFIDSLGLEYVIKEVMVSLRGREFFYRLSVVLVVILFSGCKAKQGLGLDTYSESGIAVYTSLSGVSPRLERELARKGIRRPLFINGGHFTNSKTRSVRTGEMLNYIALELPDKKSKALIVLNFEDQEMKNLARYEDESSLSEALQFYIRIYDSVKAFRPSATIGFYGLPWRNYWRRNNKWRAANTTLFPLLEKVDVLFPSIYDFYVDGMDVPYAQDSAYVYDNVLESLKIGTDLDIPVMPFVWHRYHDSNKENGRKFINLNEFQKHIATAASVVYGIKRIDGLVWWSSERYFYNITERGKLNRGTDQDFYRFSNGTTLKYLEPLITGIREGGANPKSPKS